MEIIRSNDKNNSTIHHDSQYSSNASFSNLVIQTSLSPPTQAKSHCKKRIETRPIIRKKQVRRRIHTTKPYQERLLNMAEARKEIVTALKFHRASMKKQRQQEQELEQLSPIIPTLMHQIPSKQHSEVVVPNQDFSIDFQDYYTNMDTSSLASVDLEAPKMVFEGGAVEPRGLDEEEMAEIRSIGKKLQMELDDTLNLATYAWWFRFLYSIEDDHTLCVDNFEMPSLY